MGKEVKPDGDAVTGLAGQFSKLDINSQQTKAEKKLTNNYRNHNSRLCRCCWLIFANKKECQNHECITPNARSGGQRECPTDNESIKRWNDALSIAVRDTDEAFPVINAMLLKLLPDVNVSTSQVKKKKIILQGEESSYMCCTCWQMYPSKKSLEAHVKKLKTKKLKHNVGKEKVKELGRQANGDTSEGNKQSFAVRWNNRVNRVRHVMLEQFRLVH